MSEKPLATMNSSPANVTPLSSVRMKFLGIVDERAEVGAPREEEHPSEGESDPGDDRETGRHLQRTASGDRAEPLGEDVQPPVTGAASAPAQDTHSCESRAANLPTGRHGFNRHIFDDRLLGRGSRIGLTAARLKPSLQRNSERPEEA